MSDTTTITTRARRFLDAPAGAGFPIIGYYLVAIIAIATLVIIYNVFAVANFGDVIRANVDTTLTERAERMRDVVQVNFLQHQNHLQKLERWLITELPEDGSGLSGLEAEFANAAYVVVGDHEVPVSLFLAATPAVGAPESFPGKTVPLLLTSKSVAEEQSPAQWSGSFQAQSLFWDGSFAELSMDAVRSGNVRNSALYLSGTPPVPTLTLVRPISLPGSSSTAYVLGISFNATEMLQPLSNQRIGDSGSILLVDERSGTVLSSPSRLFSARNGIIREHDPFSYNIFRNSPNGDSWNRVLTRPIGGAEVVGDDDAWYLAVASSVPDLGWSVIAYMRTSEITSRVRDRSLPMALLGLVLFILIVLAIFLLNRSLAYPLQRLLLAATRPLPIVTEENITAMRATEDGPREFATLAASYNRLLDTVSSAVHSKNEYAKKLESSHQRLKGFNRLLEKVVSDRTRELKEAKESADRARDNAERAQVAAEKANEAKSNFLANISHELRTPLNAIIGYTELLMEEAEDRGGEHEMDDLKKVLSAGRHLLSLIDDILDIAKIEAGRMRLNMDMFSITGMLNEVIEATHPLARRNQNKLIFHSDIPRDAEMKGDRTKVKQVLLNLTSNACKFTEKGSVTLSAKITPGPSGGKLVCTVEDTGIGMTQEQISRVFEKFSQADETSTRKHGGSGLGLFICRIFSEMMGGDIQIESEHGKGSRFTFLVPLEGTPVLDAEKQELLDALPDIV